MLRKLRIPPLSWYKSPFVHAPGVFFACVILFSPRHLPFLFAIGAYTFGLVLITFIAILNEFDREAQQKVYDAAPKCPACGKPL